jgi:hypothetical protein
MINICCNNDHYVDGDGVPALGYGIGLVESVLVALDAPRMRLIVDAAGERQRLGRRIEDPKLKPLVLLPIGWEIFHVDARVLAGCQVCLKFAVAGWADFVCDGDAGAALPAVNLERGLKAG